MMCACEEEFGLKYLPHQIERTRCSRSKERVPVTLGFQERVCRECRGLPLESHPKAELYGQSGKLQRYYWREISKRRIELYGIWAAEHDADPLIALSEEEKGAQKKAAQQAVREIKELHATTPKYMFDKEESQSQVLEECAVEIENVHVTYVKGPEGTRARVLWNDEPVSVEEYARRYYHERGYESLEVESIPFHVLFGVYLWPLMLDPEDERGQVCVFGERNAFQQKAPGKNIALVKPGDFGSPAYGQRRKEAIDKHFTEVLALDGLAELFEHWLEPSERLRQYLWAHEPERVAIARRVSEILPQETLLRILRYLVDSYWARYLGWPDLLVYNDSDFFFVEVKSSKDSLSNDQKRWIRDNRDVLVLPFRLFKLHRQ